jgi:hypothetical protein
MRDEEGKKRKSKWKCFDMYPISNKLLFISVSEISPRGWKVGSWQKAVGKGSTLRIPDSSKNYSSLNSPNAEIGFKILIKKP